MNTPIYTKISQEFNHSDINKVFIFEKVKNLVENDNVHDIKVTSDTLSFKVPVLGWTWDYFSFIERGKFTIDDNRLFLSLECLG